VVEPSDPAFVRDVFLKEASAAHHYSVFRRLIIAYNVDLRARIVNISTPTLVGTLLKSLDVVVDDDVVDDDVVHVVVD
jgi:hypothetical protein